MIRIHILSKEEEEKLKNLDEIRQAEKEILEKLITDKRPNWLTKAKERTTEFNRVSSFNEEAKKQTWSEIKEVYMNLQANKCAYCEQKLEDKVIEHDVEHYRPKKNVKVWLTEERKKTLKFAFPDAESEGYYLLPYNIFNYATACKHCNTILKSDCFPIAGTRLNNSDDFKIINDSEKPYLPYPLGHIDEDSPEDLISFNGASPIINPKLNDEHKKLRALITIKFFNLDALREGLIKQRCKVIKNIFEAMHIINTSTDDEYVNTKKEDLQLWLDDKSDHANCARSFFRLCFEDTNIAKEHYKLADAYVKNHPDK